MTEEERLGLERQWKQLDPETKKRIGQAMFHQSVDRFRQEFGQKSLEEQKAWVDGEVARMQERFNQLTNDERARAQERLQTPESKAFPHLTRTATICPRHSPWTRRSRRN